ncbi:hypothetical protein AD998_14470 [bacterium 336/3]|nr:hypothetical protein AD998_14470 [bacterium 336/3]
MQRICFFICTIILIGHTHSFSQNKKILDSLKNAYKKVTHDTSKVKIQLEIAMLYEKSKIDTAFAVAEKMFVQSEKLNYQRGKVQSMYIIGRKYYGEGNYPKATEYLNKSLKISEQMHYNDYVALNSNSLGNIYTFQGNFPQALNYYLITLKIKENSSDKSGTSIILNNIGNIHKKQNNYPLALEYYQKSLKIKEEIKDKQGIAVSYNNIGNIYFEETKYEQALEYYLKSLKIKEELKDKKGISASYNNIGNLYTKLTKYEQALEYYQKSIQIKDELNDVMGSIYSLQGMAEVYLAQKDYETSIEYAQQALRMSEEVKALAEINVLTYRLYEAYKLKGEYNKALEYYEYAKRTNDSIFNIDKEKAIANLESKATLEKKEKELILLAKDNELNKLNADKRTQELEIVRKETEAEQLLNLARSEKDKRKADSLFAEAQKARLEAENLRTKNENDKLEQEKRQLTYLAELEKQKNIRNTFLGIATTFLLLMVVVGIGYRQKQKSNKLLAHQQAQLVELNKNLESQKEEIETTYNQLKITSDALGKSINYASHVQGIVIAEAEDIRSFFEDVFIIYLPRDVVSGDFYWFSKISDTQSVFAVADCTGHGVPGAFMSMLGCTLLNEIINEQQIYQSPARILELLHARLHKILKQHSSKNSDGMDIGIGYFEKQANSTTKITFAGAKSNVYYFDNQELKALEGDRVFLGGSHTEVKCSDKYATLENSSTIYFQTDGYIDQNNMERKRLGSKKLQELFFEAHQKSFGNQREYFLQQLHQHQGAALQRDDITLIGILV